VKDPRGSIYFSDYDNHKIMKIFQGNLIKVAGGSGGFADGTGQSASFACPYGLVLDLEGNLIVSDRENHRIRKISVAGEVTTIAGTNRKGFGDGKGVLAVFDSPSGIACDLGGNLYVADCNNHRIRKISPEGIVTTLAGGIQGNADGIGTNAQFSYPSGVAVDVKGNVFVTDKHNHRIRKVSPQGKVSTVAGKSQGFKDGSGGIAKFDWPVGIAIDNEGSLFVAD